MKTLISSYQTTLILIFTLVATSIIFLPSLTVEQAGQDAWISIILLILIYLFVALAYSALTNKMGRMDLINFTEKVFGKIIVIPIAIYVISLFIILSGTVVRETSEVMLTAYMPLTPMWFFNITIILVAAYITNHGLEVIGRSVEILFYIFIIIFLFFIVLLIPDMSFRYLKPVLARGPKPIWEGIYPGLVFFGESFIILFLAPHLNQKKKVYKTMFYGLIISGSIFLIVILSIIMIFGPDFVNELTVPLITAFSFVERLRIIERLDALFIFLWVSGGIIKTSIFLYVIVYTARNLLNLKSNQILIPIIIPFVYYFSHYFYESTAEITDFLYRRVPYFLILQLLYPLLLLIVSWLRGINVSE